MSLIRHTSLNYHPNYHAHTTYPPIHRNSLNHHQLQVYSNPYISHPQHHYHSAPPPQYNGNLYHQYYNHQHHHHHHHHPLYHQAYNRPYQTMPHQQQQQQQHNSNLFHRQRQIQNHNNKKYSKSEASSEQLKSIKETNTPNSVKIPSIKSSMKSTINWIAKTFCFCFTDDQLFDTNSNKIVIK